MGLHGCWEQVLRVRHNHLCVCSSSHNQTQVRAEPGVGGAGQRPGSLGSVLTGRSFLSRPSGPQSLACEDAVLAKPAAPVASAAFAHADDLLSSLSALLPPCLGPVRFHGEEGDSHRLVPNPEHPARVAGRDHFCCPSAPPRSAPRVKGQPPPSTPGPERMRTRAQPGPFLSSVFATEEEAKVLGLCSRSKLRLRLEWERGRSPSQPLAGGAHGTKAHLPQGRGSN